VVGGTENTSKRCGVDSASCHPRNPPKDYAYRWSSVAVVVIIIIIIVVVAVTFILVFVFTTDYTEPAESCDVPVY
jgi:t-SNARE complex subunit (syntaxin)